MHCGLWLRGASLNNLAGTLADLICHLPRSSHEATSLRSRTSVAQHGNLLAHDHVRLMLTLVNVDSLRAVHALRHLIVLLWLREFEESSTAASRARLPKRKVCLRLLLLRCGAEKAARAWSLRVLLAEESSTCGYTRSASHRLVASHLRSIAASKEASSATRSGTSTAKAT